MSLPQLPRPRPEPHTLEGRYALLVPINQGFALADSLFEASTRGDADARFRFLFELPPSDRLVFEQWLQRCAGSSDPLYFGVVDRQTGRCEGRQSLMRITPEHWVIEIGSILWGDQIARTRVATEALYLFAEYAFDTLGYRRFEWKCNSLNEPSRRAALRFGFQFEGIFRQHMVQKGANRDTAWFAMTDGDWQQLRPGYQQWLAPENFDANGQQRRSLGACLTLAAA